MMLTSVKTILNYANSFYSNAESNIVTYLKNNENASKTKIPPTIRIAKTAADKACYLMQHERLVFVLSEIGAGQEVSKLLNQYDVDSRAIYLSISPYSREASDARYSTENIDASLFIRYISHVRLKQQLEMEYQALPSMPNVKKAVIANTMRTSHRNGHGWIGYKGQLRSNEKPVEVMMHVRLYHYNISHQKREIGRLGINLAYAINSESIVSSSELFYRSLKEGLEDFKLVEIDSISILGYRLNHLQSKAPEKLLKYELTKTVMLCGNLLVAGQSFSNQIISQLQEKKIFSIKKYEPLTNRIFCLRNTEETAIYLEKLKDSKCVRRTTEIISEIISSAIEPIDRKIKTMNTRGFVQGKICETNHTDLIQMLSSRPFSPIYESCSLNSRNLAARYNLHENHCIDKESITEILNQDYESIQLPSPPDRQKQILRKFSLFKHVENNTKKAEGWIALKAQTQVDKAAQNIIINIKGSGPTTLQTSKIAAKLAVNLWYGFFNNSNNEALLPNRLLEGIDTNEHTIGIHVIEDTGSVQGKITCA